MGEMATAIVNSTAKQSRRSVRSLSVQEKVHAIDRVHEGESKASVARDIGVPESTLRGWCKGEEKLRGIVARSGGNSSSSSSNEPPSVDDSLDKKPELSIKREYDEDLATAKKFAKVEALEDISDSRRKSSVSPINFSKENDYKEDVREGQPMAAVPTLPALAAIASAFTGKNQLLYNAYANGVLTDMVGKQEMNNKPLDYSTKVSSRIPRPEVNEALMYWLQAQREQAALPMSPMEARTADTSGWFWKLYKNCGVLPQSHKTSSSNGQVSDEEDEPPATAADAVRHGEKFLRWLECCSDPSVTALQILQFRYLLKNVKECAERRRQVRTKARSRRK